MAKLIIQCGNCGEEREVDEKMAGSTLACAGCGETIRIPLPDIGEGVVLGGFVLERLLGFGAMGEVWLAHQQTMDRKVALKLLSREFTMDSQFVDRFLKEVRMSAKMDHPNIITAFDAGCENDIYYLAISFVDGQDLDQRLEETKILPEKEALRIVREISSALCYAWNDFKILHRDIKPSNIMIDKKGSAKLMDMGISKSTNEEAQLTMTGTVIGTPYYMSPEQGMGEKSLDCRSDIYSLGATLYHLVTGSLPFEATTAIGIISKHITEPLPSPQNANPNLSDQCTTLLEIMMAKGVDDRQQTWEEVMADIDNVTLGKMPGSKQAPAPGDSVIMPVAVQPQPAIPAHAQPTAVMPEESAVGIPPTASQTATASQVGVPPQAGPAPRNSKAPLIICLSVAVILAMLAAALFVFSPDDKPVDDGNQAGLGDPFPEELNPEPKPELRPQPQLQPQPQPQPQVDPNEKKYQEMWKFAAKYAKDNPKNYDVAINNFEEISRTAGGSKYKMMADVEINKLQKAKDRALVTIMQALHKRVKPFKDKKDYHHVADLYIEYNGPMAEETQPERQRLYDEYRRRGDEHQNKQQTEQEKKQEEMREVVSRIIQDLIDGQIKNARVKLQIASQKVMLPGDIREPLEQLLNISKRISDSFEKDIGKKVTIKLSKGSLDNVPIKKVKGSIVYYQEKKGRVTLEKRLSLSKLSEDEIIKRSGMNSVAIAMYKSLKAARAKDFNVAKRYAERIQPQNLAEIFGETMGRHYMPEEMHEPNDQRVTHNNPPNNQNNFRDPDNPDDNFEPRRMGPDNQGSSNNAWRELHAELKKNNREYNGRARIFGQNGKIEGLDCYEATGIDNEALKIIAKLKDLKRLDLGQADITDITPLTKTKIKWLMLGKCDQLKDLKPLSKIKTLMALSIYETQIEDISPLKGLDLKMLDISRSKVKDISVIKNMPIKELRMMDCAIQDYSPIKTLKDLEFMEPRHLWQQIPGKEHMQRDQRNRAPGNLLAPGPMDNQNMNNQPNHLKKKIFQPNNNKRW